MIVSAETKWFPLNPDNHSEYVRKITRTKMDLNDDYRGMSQDLMTGHFIESEQMRSLSYFDSF